MKNDNTPETLAPQKSQADRVFNEDSDEKETEIGWGLCLPPRTAYPGVASPRITSCPSVITSTKVVVVMVVRSRGGQSHGDCNHCRVCRPKFCRLPVLTTRQVTFSPPPPIFPSSGRVATREIFNFDDCWLNAGAWIPPSGMHNDGVIIASPLSYFFLLPFLLTLASPFFFLPFFFSRAPPPSSSPLFHICTRNKQQTNTMTSAFFSLCIPLMYLVYRLSQIVPLLF